MSLRIVHKPNVTAGLTCEPETAPMLIASITSVKPIASAPTPPSLNVVKATSVNTNVPISSAKIIFMIFDGNLALLRLVVVGLAAAVSFFGASTFSADTVRTVVLLATVFLAVVFFLVEAAFLVAMNIPSFTEI